MTITDLVATPSQTVGPFFHFGLTPTARVGGSPSAESPGRCLRVSVFDGEGTPVPDAWLEIWQGGANEPSAVGRLATDDSGTCEFEVLRTGTHLNVCVFARGLLRHVMTRIYFDDDRGLGDDPVLALVPSDRRNTLVAHRQPGDPACWWFPIRLQGHDETVFFHA